MNLDLLPTMLNILSISNAHRMQPNPSHCRPTHRLLKHFRFPNWNWKRNPLAPKQISANWMCYPSKRDMSTVLFGLFPSFKPNPFPPFNKTNKISIYISCRTIQPNNTQHYFANIRAEGGGGLPSRPLIVWISIQSRKLKRLPNQQKKEQQSARGNSHHPSTYNISTVCI